MVETAKELCLFGRVTLREILTISAQAQGETRDLS